MSLASLACAAALFQTPGVAIKDLSLGAGAEAALGDHVSLQFRATVVNGQIFDSTFGQPPFAIRLGWRPRYEGYVRLPFASFDRAVAGMKVGGKRSIVLSPEASFGDLEIGEFPKGSPLTIEVELLEVLKKGAVPTVKIEELVPGGGLEVATGKRVSVHYRGTFLNGVEFDASRRAEPGSEEPVGEPLTFEYGKPGMIKGFVEGLKGMKVGGKRRVTVPYNLAYGEFGRDRIPPFTTLVFELELIAVS